MRPTGSKPQLEARRRLAVELFNEGLRICEVAQLVGVSHTSVRRFVNAFKLKGADGLNPIPHPGKVCKLSEDDLAKLKNMLCQGARLHGYLTELWTLERVVALIHRHFGIKYHFTSVWHILRKLGFSCQKPERRAREADDQAIENWRDDEWPRIKKIS